VVTAAPAHALPHPFPQVWKRSGEASWRSELGGFQSAMSKYLLLTGSTGLVGQYLLRDLLLEQMPVAVLIRSQEDATAQERLEQVMSHWESELYRKLPRPVCLEGDITAPDLGLTPE